ncbi:hypothetical protein G6O69_37325 [Pseudenhygromyxa sp. WMMC2535]|uniref:hypothetical protein n=1 Tax=Pseudenhygromyxa sp. WMMC2535 TaxID=2712867 RepID=UPI0015553E14|nr:hypothetical protein [Pseudenhygromyxa sp. WMMC2535]NVB40298.1 hypothetical protein [Pseudenhygromyxa sp. WMMC2535]NVB43537.1 hypothetical protein [Pseudenhygromyxa sp. WMMC2535]
MLPDGQPPNPYAQPTRAPDPNPYGPPNPIPAWAEGYAEEDYVPQGTYWGGFAAGFVLALLGLLGVYIFGKEETKRGSLHGFGIRVGLSMLFWIFTFAMS